jgi:hypothetical protein
MKRAAPVVLALAAVGFAAGFLYARLAHEVIPTIQERREAGPTRVVPAEWRVDRFSPGHSQHVINLALDCNACHDPAKEDFGGVDFGVCTACHLEQAAYPHIGEEGEITSCFDCHVFKFASGVASAWDCQRCHGPFNTPTHAGLAMHATMDCGNCHDPHLPTVQTVAECATCHSGIELRHGRPELSGTCADCHGGHKLASEATACMECHQAAPAQVPSTAVFSGGHTACVDCHEPHAFSASTALGCDSCHKRQPVLAQRKVKAHRDCGSCHEPHAVRAAGDRTCMGCHREVASTHPVGKQGECVACHDPHPARVTQIALQCSACHEEAGSERAFHAPKTACTDCHEPHRFDLSAIPERTLCAECHARQIRLTEPLPGHASCESCHTGTAHVLEGPVACASCHQSIAASSPKGHRECASCHEPHGGHVAAATACTSCHDASKLPGLHRIPEDPKSTGHADCSTCHHVHRAEVRADRASCMECHTDIANHQPDADVCTGCHTFIGGRPASPLTPRATPRRQAR